MDSIDSNTNQLMIVGGVLVLVEQLIRLLEQSPLHTSRRQLYIFVDTSVLIDGRILAIAASGFITGVLAIPRSVIGELQLLADNADQEKRSRARHGLDVAKELQDLKTVDVELFQDGSRADEGVDERLLSLAKDYGGAVCTIDYNLSKVADVEGIRVCNVNELAKNLRMAYLPGEKETIELVQKGQDSHQGVGYLADGTMVVVEHASSQIGQKVEVEFIRSLQTAAGRMMFAKKIETSNPKTKDPKKSRGRAPAKQSGQSRQSRQPAKKPTAKQQAKPQQNKSRQQRRKPRDHEDALVRLANS